MGMAEAAPPRTDLDEEEGSIGGGVAIDVDPSCELMEATRRTASTMPTMVPRCRGDPIGLGPQVVLKAREETIRVRDRGKGALWSPEGSDKVPEMKADRTFQYLLIKYMKGWIGWNYNEGDINFVLSTI